MAKGKGKKAKRRKDAPGFVQKGEMPVGPQVKRRRKLRMEAARRRRRAILDRTAAGRARIAELAAGADMSDLDQLEVITFPQGIARRRGMRTKGKGSLPDDDQDEVEAPPPERPPIAPPVPPELRSMPDTLDDLPPPPSPPDGVDPELEHFKRVASIVVPQVLMEHALRDELEAAMARVRESIAAAFEVYVRAVEGGAITLPEATPEEPPSIIRPSEITDPIEVIPSLVQPAITSVPRLRTYRCRACGGLGHHRASARCPLRTAQAAATDAAPSATPGP